MAEAQAETFKGKHYGRKRLKQIISVFVRHGISGGALHLADPASLRKALEELGPTFIKIGQILSTRPDILPENYLQEFARLQDSARPETAGEILLALENALEMPVTEAFSWVCPQPVACASMAQVHEARLPDKTPVILKIQRPGAEDTMRRDFLLFRKLIRLARFTPQASVIDLEGALDELWAVLEKELDFHHEAENLKRFRQCHENRAGIICPDVFDEYSRKSLLVMSKIEGVNLQNPGRLESEGYDTEEIAVKLVHDFLRQVFEDGFFHADPHPGNIFVTGSKICFLDFGMMGVLDQKTVRRLEELLISVADRDIDGLTRAVLRIGIKKGKMNIKALRADIAVVFESYIDAALDHLDVPVFLDEILRACRRNHIAMPAGVTTLMKGMVSLEGTVAKLAPGMNLMDFAMPFAKKLIRKNIDWKSEVQAQGEALLMLARHGLKFPMKLMRLMDTMADGRLSVSMEHKGLDQSMHELHRMMNRLASALIVAALIVGAALVLNANAGPRIYGVSAIGLIAFTGAGVMGLWLLVGIFRSGRM